MGIPLTIVLWSGGMMVALISLFRYERVRGARFFYKTRGMFDRSLEDTKLHIGQKYRRVTSQTIRQSVHYIFHTILTWLLHKIERLEHSVRSVARFNKSRAKRRRENKSTSHLSVVSDHKRNTQLSETERQHMRDKALSGR